ncbi:hypothetical protein [Methylobacterium sp. E-045]|uniref:hypothetical protein n=1 Tax=Methylobacterium sp. E-045 TaxID=2836575 RepID=UPI001FB8B6F5|nr:hypothetical protein [Methylobacterium sp. E-045]MCJ2127572.1 hypothetical protein [Methylobacterium sp. E-045]
MATKLIGLMPNHADAKASLASQRLIGQLRRSEIGAAAQLADSLDVCTTLRPCRSAACPMCGAEFQDVMVAINGQFIRIPARSARNRAHAVTIVPSTGCVKPEDLSVEAFVKVGDEITTALIRLDYPPTLIGLEASFNEDATGKVEPHWCIHGHTNSVDWPTTKQENGIRAAFLASPWIKYPVHIDLLDDRIEGRRYPFKPERFRRVTQLITDNPGRRPYRDTKQRALRPWQAVSLAIVEHELGFERRLRIHGIDEKAFGEGLRGLDWPWGGF